MTDQSLHWGGPGAFLPLLPRPPRLSRDQGGGPGDPPGHRAHPAGLAGSLLPSISHLQEWWSRQPDWQVIAPSAPARRWNESKGERSERYLVSSASKLNCFRIFSSVRTFTRPPCIIQWEVWGATGQFWDPHSLTELYLKVHTDPQSELLVSLPDRPGRLPLSHLPRHLGEKWERLQPTLAHFSQAVLLQTRVGAVWQEGGPSGEVQRGLKGEVQPGPGEDEGAAVQVAEPHLRPLDLQSPRRAGEAEWEDHLHGALQLMWRCWLLFVVIKLEQN